MPRDRDLSPQNHIAIFKNSGLTVKEYPYWSASGKCLDFDGMLATLTDAPNGSSVSSRWYLVSDE